jgi:formyl-CoA transferase
VTAPLEDVKVVELGHALAGPFASTLLADFGARVVKVERPGTGDSLRAMGPKHEGVGVWWSVAGRNKRSIAVDYKQEAGREVLLDLIGRADVLIENFRTGALERVGLGWSDLSPRHPRLIMLRISGFGQTGPYSHRAGFGKIAEAFSGATHLTGHPDAPPVHPGYSLGDATTGLMGAFGVMLALHARETTGRGQLVDLALYESLFRMIEWQLPLLSAFGTVADRSGPRFPFDGAFITDVCSTSDGESVVVSAATTESLERLQAFVAREGLIGPEADVDPNVAAVNGLRTWVARHTREETLARLESEGLVVGAVFTAADIADDPHFAARENIVQVPTGSGSELPMPSVVPSLSETPGEVRRRAPQLGEHAAEVLAELGYTDERCRELMESGVVAEPSGVGV